MQEILTLYLLVGVQNITVTDDTPDDPDTGEFIVTGNLRIDNEIFLIDPDPVVDVTFTYIRGILNYSSGDSKILPREDLDVQI